nr:unnamed protein product [Digitaria exilis]
MARPSAVGDDPPPYSSSGKLPSGALLLRLARLDVGSLQQRHEGGVALAMTRRPVFWLRSWRPRCAVSSLAATTSSLAFSLMSTTSSSFSTISPPPLLDSAGQHHLRRSIRSHGSSGIPAARHRREVAPLATLRHELSAAGSPDVVASLAPTTVPPPPRPPHRRPPHPPPPS